MSDPNDETGLPELEDALRRLFKGKSELALCRLAESAADGLGSVLAMLAVRQPEQAEKHIAKAHNRIAAAFQTTRDVIDRMPQKPVSRRRRA